MNAPPLPRELALDAAKQAINALGMWLPPAGREAAVDAVAAVYEAELNRSQRRAVAFQTRLDAARDWARQHLKAEQQDGLLEALRGDTSNPNRQPVPPGDTGDDLAWTREMLLAAQGEATNEATRADQAEATLAALRHGEEQPADEYLHPTPAQWLWRWNRATPEQRLDTVGRILSAFETSSRCFIEAHASRAEDGRTAMAAVGRVRALADELDATEAHGGLADGYWEAARRIRAALEAPKEN